MPQVQLSDFSVPHTPAIAPGSGQPPAGSGGLVPIFTDKVGVAIGTPKNGAVWPEVRYQFDKIGALQKFA